MSSRHVSFVVYRYAHHSPHSGYSRLAEYGVGEYGGQVLRIAKPLPRTIIRERILWRLSRGTPGYDRAAMAAELNVAWRAVREPDHIFHFLYGETTYHYAGLLDNVRGSRMVATFHQPPDGIREAVQIDWHIRRLSAAICVGRTQQDYLSGILDPERVIFAPLGVDTDYFVPPASFDARDSDLCLCVGENYRDFPTLRGVIELVSYLRPRTRFVVVLSPRSFPLLGSHPNLTLLSGVSEADLRQLYQSAALMVLPMHDTTANNAVLESMACGLPLVASDVGAIRDYANDEHAILVRPGNARAMADAILGALDEPRHRQRLAANARRQALTLSWAEVVKCVRPAYSR